MDRRGDHRRPRSPAAWATFAVVGYIGRAAWSPAISPCARRERVRRIVLVGCDDRPLIPHGAMSLRRCVTLAAGAVGSRGVRRRRTRAPDRRTTCRRWRMGGHAAWPAAPRLGALRTPVMLAVGRRGRAPRAGAAAGRAVPRRSPRHRHRLRGRRSASPELIRPSSRSSQPPTDGVKRRRRIVVARAVGAAVAFVGAARRRGHDGHPPRVRAGRSGLSRRGRRHAVQRRRRRTPARADGDARRLHGRRPRRADGARSPSPC